MSEKNKRCAVIVSLVVISVFLLTVNLIFDAGLLMTCVLIAWSSLVVYALSDIKRHFVFLCFLISFFVFLLGREICFTYFGLERYYNYLEPYNDITFFLMLLSLLFLFAGYRFADRHRVERTGRWFSVKRDAGDAPAVLPAGPDPLRNRIRMASMIAFYFCCLCSMLDAFMQIRQVASVGYLASYMEVNSYSGGILGYFSTFTVIALSIYLVTFPKKRISLLALISFEFYGVMTLMTGHRYTFIAVSMYVLAYIVYRHYTESGWITKKMVLLMVAALPLLVVLMTVMDSLRSGTTGTGGGLMRTAINFMDQQGGSINCIKRIFYYQDQLSDMSWTSFSNTRSVLLENGLMRNLFNIKVYDGNSVENALYGHYLSHRLSYLEYGQYYLLGHGVGSSYIAELFHDFGYIGVALGSLIYGYLLRRITNIGTGRFYRDGLLFATQYFMYLSPRGDFDGMISGLFSVLSVLGLVGIWVLSQVFRYGESRKAKEITLDA